MRLASPQEVRKISFALRPPVLDDLGLAPALRWMLSDLAGSAGLKAEFVADSNLRRADAESETACYRVAVEAVTNSIRHAGARKIAMELRNIDHTIQLHVRDDGRGFDFARIESNFFQIVATKAGNDPGEEFWFAASVWDSPGQSR